VVCCGGAGVCMPMYAVVVRVHAVMRVYA